MTKKFVAGVLALSMTASAFALPASAMSAAPAPAEAETGAPVSVGKVAKNSKFTYRVEPEGTITILNLSKKAINSKGVVTIPSKIGGKKVTALSYTCSDFFLPNWKKIKVVDFPKTIQRLEYDCGIGYKYSSTAVNGGGGGSPVWERNQNVTIKCYSGTAAEDYAIDRCVPYKLKDKTSTPQGVVFKDKMSMGSSAVKFSWFPATGASGYQVLRREGYGDDDFKVIKTITGKSNTTFKDSGLKKNVNYSYKVVAYKKTSSGKKLGIDSSPIYVTVKPGQPKITKATPENDDMIAFSTDNSKFDNYGWSIEVYDSLAKKWGGANWSGDWSDQNVKCAIYGYYLENPYTDRSIYQTIVSGQKYKVRMRCYGSIDGAGTYKQVFGKYSNTLTLKAK